MKNFFEHTAHILSLCLSPILMPVIAIIITFSCTYLSIMPTFTKCVVTSVAIILTIIVPIAIISALHSMGRVTDIGLNRRQDRMIPYLIMIACYTVLCIYLYMLHAPLWLVAFLAGGIAAAVINTIVNIWWKISAHLAGIGGVVAFTYILFSTPSVISYHSFGLMVTAIICAGLLGSSRILLQRHTLWQVLTGFANGFFCVYALMKISLIGFSMF